MYIYKPDLGLDNLCYMELFDHFTACKQMTDV